MDLTEPSLLLDDQILCAVGAVGLKIRLLAGLAAREALPPGTDLDACLQETRAALVAVHDWLDSTARVVTLFGAPTEPARFATELTTVRQHLATFLQTLEAWQDAAQRGDVDPAGPVPWMLTHNPALTPDEEAYL